MNSYPPPLPAARPRRRGCWITLLVLGVLALLAAVVAVIGVASVGMVGGAGSAHQVQREHLQGKMRVSGGYLASIQIDGAIMDSEGPLAVLKAAREDAHCKGVLLEVNSPGGGVTASDEIWDGIRRVQAAGKPVTVYMGALAASGGYYISAPAEWIIASPTTLTGSIGVIIQAPAYGDALGRIGVSMRTFTSGKNKAMLSPTEELTPEQAALVQGLVDSSYDRFVSVVAQGRKIDEQSLRTGIADGRVVDAKIALEQRLVDQLGYREDALGKALELAKLPADAPVIRLSRTMGLAQLLGLGAQHRGKVQVELAPQVLPELQSGLPYYLAPQGLGPQQD